MLLQNSTWPEVESYLERSRGIIVPIGSTEQHGPNGMIGTDAICPEVVAHEVGKRDNVLIAPTISIGMAQHHLAFPGSISLRPSTLMALISDVVESLVRHGFDHIYFLNGHGGNIATITASFSEIWAKRSLQKPSPTATQDPEPTLRLACQNWWNADGISAISSRRFSGAEGSHATPSEVSLTWYAYPEHARPDIVLEPAVAPYGRIRDAQNYRTSFPDGRIGSNPGLASVEAGAELFETSVNGIRNDYQRFLET